MILADFSNQYDLLLEFFMSIGYTIKQVQTFTEKQLSDFIQAVLDFQSTNAIADLKKWVDGYFGIY
jgi:hypothetical protein